MNSFILDSIPFSVNLEILAQMLHVEKGDAYDELAELLDKARQIGKPKARYRTVFIESRGDDFVVIEGITFKSRVLQVNFENIHRVFPFVATCGAELHEWAYSLDDDLHRYWAEGIMGLALLNAIGALDNHIKEQYGLKKISHMAPGSLEDWPIEEQVPLFKLLGDTKSAVGVELTDSFLMTPTKTVSGIRFPTEVDYENCMLCPQKDCPGRRAKYDKDMYDRKYRKK